MTGHSNEHVLIPLKILWVTLCAALIWQKPLNQRIHEHFNLHLNILLNPVWHQPHLLQHIVKMDSWKTTVKSDYHDNAICSVTCAYTRYNKLLGIIRWLNKILTTATAEDIQCILSRVCILNVSLNSSDGINSLSNLLLTSQKFTPSTLKVYKEVPQSCP